MKKVLFVLHRIGIGGSMTSMLNLLELLKADGMEIDLLLMDHSGCFLNRAKEAADLLPEYKPLASVICNKDKLIKNFDLPGLINRIWYIARHRITHGRYNYEQVFCSAAQYFGGYDTAVAFQEGLTTEFVKYIDCPNKIAWVHNELKWISGGKDSESVSRTYRNFQKIVCVSKAAQESMVRDLDLGTIPIMLIYNTLNIDLIREKSVAFNVDRKENVLNFVSLGRFAEQKRFDRVVEIAKLLKAEGKTFCWKIIGDGELFPKIYSMAEDAQILDVVEFVGAASNPYPYIQASDCMILPSLYEAHPMAAIEALLLGKPVITTNYPSASEVITDGVDGMIAENSAEGVYLKVKQLFEQPRLLCELSEGAQAYTYRNDEILSQVKSIL